jgi:CubicO group peptidase (beta-lactamase class C family)
MRSIARLVGLAACLLVLLTTCSAPRLGERPARISAFVAQEPVAPGMPTVQPTVTPASVPPSDGEPTPASSAATPALVLPAANSPPPLSAAMLPAAGQPLTPELAAKAAQMDGYMRSLAEAGAFSGTALVAWRGQILLSGGYGMADASAGLGNAPSTRFRLASVSKPLTAIVVMQLAAAGKIDLNASICTYLSGCPAAWQPVMVRNLLNHSSGIANYTDFASFADVEQRPASVEQVIARFRDLPLGFTPGSGYQYCNSNYVLLGRMIEEVSGLPYADYMRERLFGPLGMGDSGYDSGDGAALNGTRGYASLGVPAIPIDTSNLFAAGSLYSSATDLYRLAQALDGGSLLAPEIAAQMYAPLYYSYGYGWKIEQRYGRRVIYHPGYMSGAATYLGRYPEDGLTVVVLSNLEVADVVGAADALAGIALN